LRRYFDLPLVNLPDFGLEGDFKKIGFDDIERYAAECRKLWHLGSAPIVDLCSLLESNGIIVSQIFIGADSADAFSQWSDLDKTPYIVLGNDKKNAARSRFDAAHELFHLLAHRHVDKKRVNSPADWKLLETQAHYFAGSLLMPADGFARELWSPTLDSMLNIKERWRVSVGAMIKRCEALDIVNEEQAKRLWINYSRRGWRSGEPLDSRVASEGPVLLRRSFEMLVKEGGQYPQQILSQLHLNPNDVEEIANLPNGFFTAAGHPSFAVPRLKAVQPQASEGSAEIIDLSARRA
jgi:Zn-dependent peptidase ImmA (M78 family)